MSKRNYTKYNKRIGEIFIKEYNRIKETSFDFPPLYQDREGFPDITFVNTNGGELKVEIVKTLPINHGNKISQHDRLKNLFRKKGIPDGFTIAIFLRQGITEEDIVREITIDKNFFQFIKDKCDEVNKAYEAKKEFRKNLPLGSKIMRITIISKEIGNTPLEVHISLNLADKPLNPFADLEKAVRDKLKKYAHREMSDTLLLLDGISRPLPLATNRSRYIEEIEILFQIKQSLGESKFFKEVWLLACNQEKYFVQQLI